MFSFFAFSFLPLFPPSCFRSLTLNLYPQYIGKLLLTLTTQGSRRRRLTFIDCYLVPYSRKEDSRKKTHISRIKMLFFKRKVEEIESLPPTCFSKTLTINDGPSHNELYSELMKTIVDATDFDVQNYFLPIYYDRAYILNKRKLSKISKTNSVR